MAASLRLALGGQRTIVLRGFLYGSLLGIACALRSAALFGAGATVLAAAFGAIAADGSLCRMA